MLALQMVFTTTCWLVFERLVPGRDARPGRPGLAAYYTLTLVSPYVRANRGLTLITCAPSTSGKTGDDPRRVTKERKTPPMNRPCHPRPIDAALAPAPCWPNPRPGGRPAPPSPSGPAQRRRAATGTRCSCCRAWRPATSTTVPLRATSPAGLRRARLAAGPQLRPAHGRARGEGRAGDELHEKGRRVSLVGWSLGGVYAREIAKLVPERALRGHAGQPLRGQPERQQRVALLPA